MYVVQRQSVSSTEIENPSFVNVVASYCFSHVIYSIKCMYESNVLLYYNYYEFIFKLGVPEKWKMNAYPSGEELIFDNEGDFYFNTTFMIVSCNG